MGVILGIIGALVAVVGIAWRIQMAMRGAEIVKDVAEEAINLPRKMKFRAKANKKRLAAVEDPREAAAVLLLAMARAGGEVSADQKQTIRDQMEAEFDVNAATSEELLIRASWFSDSVVDPLDVVARMTDFVAQNAPDEARPSLANMLDAVARCEGEPARDQVEFLRRFRERAGLN